jgi:sarcosine oxidase subunit gamma
MPSLEHPRIGPLHGRTLSVEGFSLAPAPDAARLVFRGRGETVDVAGRALELDLPREPCRGAVSDVRSALWMGPDEWLLLMPCTEAAKTTERLITALSGLPHSLVDASHRNAGLEATGPRAATVLNAGCPLDLYPAAFPTGMCTRTVLAKAEIVLWRTGPQRFHVETWRSFADYVWRFLEQAAKDIDA